MDGMSKIPRLTLNSSPSINKTPTFIMDQSTLTIKAIGNRHSLWGEGPIWWNDSLYYVDIEGKAIIRLNPDSEEETIWEFPERDQVITYSIAGLIFICKPDQSNNRKIEKFKMPLYFESGHILVF